MLQKTRQPTNGMAKYKEQWLEERISAWLRSPYSRVSHWAAAESAGYPIKDRRYKPITQEGGSGREQ